MKKNKSTFVKLLKRIKKHSFFIILSLIMAAVTVATTLYVPTLSDVELTALSAWIMWILQRL